MGVAVLRGITWRHVVGTLLFLAGFAMTVWLGVLSAADEPPSRATSALLVILAGIFQIGSASTFHGIGKADPGLARAAVRRLVRMANRAEAAETLAQQAFESGNATEMRRVMGLVSVHVSYLQEGTLDAIDDWVEFHETALRNVVQEAGDDD